MDKVNGLSSFGNKRDLKAKFFWPELLKKLGLQEKKLFELSPKHLREELQARNLANYSPRLRTRIEVLLLILNLHMEGSNLQEINIRDNRLLAVELLFQAGQIARDKGEISLEGKINSFLQQKSLGKEWEKFFRQFSQLLRREINNRAELKILNNQVDQKGLRGLHQYLKTAELARLNRASATRFLALKYLLDYILENEAPDGKIITAKHRRNLELDLPEIYNKMLLTVSRERLNLLLPAVEKLSLWSGQELGQVAREESSKLANDQRFSPGVIDFILGRLKKLVFMEENPGSIKHPEISQQEKMAVAIQLRNNYPATYRYYRQLGLPFLPPEEEEIGPKFGPCFVAGVVLTKAEEEKYIAILKFWRSHYLNRHLTGRLVILLYYRTGPFLAKVLSEFPFLRGPVRRCLIIVAQGFLLRFLKNKRTVEEDENVSI